MAVTFDASLDDLIARIRLRHRFAVITDPNWPDNPIIHATQDFAALTGYAPDEAIGRNCRFLQGPGTEPAARDAMRAAVSAAQAVEVIITNHRKDGSPFLNRVIIRPVFSGRKDLLYFVGVQNLAG